MCRHSIVSEFRQLAHVFKDPVRALGLLAVDPGNREANMDHYEVPNHSVRDILQADLSRDAGESDCTDTQPIFVPSLDNFTRYTETHCHASSACAALACFSSWATTRPRRRLEEKLTIRES
jgi:hypothetical protein